MSSAEDRELFRVARLEGDDAAWRILYHRHTPSLHRLARHLGDSDSDAGDLVHDMWLRALRGGTRFEERSSFRTWLTGILINCVRESRRAAHRLAEVPLEDDLAAAEPPSGLDRMDLERAVATLAPGYREVLLLHDVEGYTHQEIAGLLGIEPGTSKSQLARARHAMMRAFALREGALRV